MKRIKKSARRYGRGESPVATGMNTHDLKFGWKTNIGQKSEHPIKLGGGLICLSTLDANNRPVIDYEAMQRLGCARADVDKALAEGFKSDLLPKQFHFVIMADAVKSIELEYSDEAYSGLELEEDYETPEEFYLAIKKARADWEAETERLRALGEDVTKRGPFESETWNYPGTISEGYELYTKAGLFCHGDGASAYRKDLDQNNKPTGTKACIECNPYGKAGVDPACFCPFSGPGKDCKYHAQIAICLLIRDQDGKLRPLSPELGMQARARINTSSEYGGMDALEQLDRAADRVGGHINGLTGMIVFSRKRRRMAEGQAIVGHISFVIDEESIRTREAALREDQDHRIQNQIEMAKAGVPLLDAPPISVPFERMMDGPRAVPVQDAEPVAPKASMTIPADVSPETREALVEMGEAAVSALTAEDELMINGMVAALDTYVQGLVKPDWTMEQALRASAEMAEPRTKGLNLAITSAEWFLQGPTPDQRERRIRLLRSICESLSTDPSFKMPALAEPVAAGEEY